MAVTRPLILITGANQGLGFATAQQLASTGKYNLLIGARSQEEAEEAIKQLQESSIDSSLTPIVVDLDQDESIAAAAKFIEERFGSLNILINNAGINRSSDPNVTLRETYRAVFETNVFGVAVMNATFILILRASKYHDRRIVNVTSGLGQIGIAYSPTSEYSAKIWELPVYRSSKLAINIINAVDAVSLKKENILSVLAAPGFCRTNFWGGNGVKSANEGAQPIVRAAIEGTSKELFGKLVDDENTLVEFQW
ncbi:Short-chain dehydrogenase/reductase SDR [Penicillium robsamsonii]|uniref:Short-chain dehydrogenase/reductase SDR n=1 Tax=Penicillium robsamsonii TaxID=1792511 RepID=UPI0025494F54|nr:Short-chain dehydrogenase/reductase SDR [Penicillium robsamsonii]KAJ5817609.1 Short-chain dehydrogenase/reductase SDR [Penicillium robsamsonii]